MAPKHQTCHVGCIKFSCCVFSPSAEREGEFTLTETTPTSPSPASYSPARSVHSVGVSSASSPTAAVSPEYTGVTSTTGETGVAVTHSGCPEQAKFHHTHSRFSAPSHLSLCSIYVSTRRCSVIYLVPYIHSDNSRRLHSRGRAAAVLYEEQCTSPSSVLHPPDASLHPQRGAWVIMISVLRFLETFQCCCFF